MNFKKPLLFLGYFFGASAQDNKGATRHSVSDYSNNFLSTKDDYRPLRGGGVWTAPYQLVINDGEVVNGTYIPTYNLTAHTINPYKQTAEPFNITFRFADSDGHYHSNCNMSFTPLMQKLQRDILYKELQGNILPNNIKFQEVDAKSDADITYVMCTNLASAGWSEYPDSSGTQVSIDKSLSDINSIDNLYATVVGYTHKIEYLAYVLRHEAGHSLGLRHTHNKGKQANTDLQTGYTARSSIMSYDSDLCSLDNPLRHNLYKRSLLWAYYTWDKFPALRDSYGPVDKINLRYAYDPTAPSISYNQTDETFPCDAQRPSPITSTYMSAEAQMALGFGIAALFVALPHIKRKAAEYGYDKVASAAGDIESLTLPSPRLDNAHSYKIAENVTKDLILAGGRILFPVAAITHDAACIIGEAIPTSDKQRTATKALTGLALSATSYYIWRRSGIPLYGVHDFTLSNANPREDVSFLKESARLIVNVRAIRYVVPDSVYNWANGDLIPALNNNTAPDDDTLSLAEAGLANPNIQPTTQPAPQPAPNTLIVSVNAAPDDNTSSLTEAGLANPNIQPTTQPAPQPAPNTLIVSAFQDDIHVGRRRTATAGALQKRSYDDMDIRKPVDAGFAALIERQKSLQKEKNIALAI